MQHAERLDILHLPIPMSDSHVGHTRVIMNAVTKWCRANQPIRTAYTISLSHTSGLTFSQHVFVVSLQSPGYQRHQSESESDELCAHSQCDCIYDAEAAAGSFCACSLAQWEVNWQHMHGAHASQGIIAAHPLLGSQHMISIPFSEPLLMQRDRLVFHVLKA